MIDKDLFDKIIDHFKNQNEPRLKLQLHSKINLFLYDLKNLDIDPKIFL